MNHEAWAIPYADLMTLLLAFFVVMYAVSVVNEGKYRVASESLTEAFNGSGRSLTPATPGHVLPSTQMPALGRPTASAGVPLAVIPLTMPVPSTPTPAVKGDAVRAADSARAGGADNLARMEAQVRRALQPLIDKALVVIRHGPDWLEIEIRTDILFPSGTAQLSLPADDVLRRLASILVPFDNPLRIEGFTDNVPIATATYPSNWELSAARAATVARQFAQYGVRADRLGIVGWGDVRPIADNATAEGRNRNRRVLVVVKSEHAPAGRATEDIDQLEGATALTSATTAAARPDAATPPAGKTATSAVSATALLADAPSPNGAASATPDPAQAGATAPPAPLPSAGAP